MKKGSKKAVFLGGILMAALLFAACGSDGNIQGSSETDEKSNKNVAAASREDPGTDGPQQLKLLERSESFSLLSETMDKGAFARYTVLTFKEPGYDALQKVIAQINENEKMQAEERAKAHVNDPDSAAKTESDQFEEMLEGQREVSAVPFINFLSQVSVTRSDSLFVSLLFTKGVENERWGKQVYFTGKTYETKTGKEVALADLVKDPARLPKLLSEALHERYFKEGMIGEDEDAAEIVSRQLEEGTLCWTADYLGMHFYFGSDDFEFADDYQGMFVSLPYSRYPELFDERLFEVPDNYIALLDYDYTYEIPSNEKESPALTVRVERTQSGSGEGLRDWMFTVKSGESSASYYPSCYDMYRQKDVGYLVHIDGKNYLYGHGDRTSTTVESVLYTISEKGVELTEQRKDGFFGRVPYSVYAFPHDPGQVSFARYAVLAGKGLWIVKNCVIDAQTGQPDEPEYGTVFAENLAFKTRQAVPAVLVEEDGTAGEEIVLPENTALRLYRGEADKWYDMIRTDGSICRITMQDPYRIDGHYTDDVLSAVPAAAAEEATITTGARKWTVWVHGKEWPIVPETGNAVGTGAIIDFGDSVWWVEEEFIGRFVMSEEDLEQEDAAGITGGSIEIREDGTLTMIVEYESGVVETYEGLLEDGHGYGVWPRGSVTREGGSFSQEFSVDYTEEDEQKAYYEYEENPDGVYWQHIEIYTGTIPYPFSEEYPPLHLFFTRES